jgi:hypothetical protein
MEIKGLIPDVSPYSVELSIEEDQISLREEKIHFPK